MPKLLAMSALMTTVAALLAAPGSAFAQTCNPAIAAGFLQQCPPVERHIRIYHGDYYHDHGDGGFHDDHGFHGNGGYNDFNRGNNRGGGMGQGVGRTR
jgi:hypothetical protein